MRIAVPRETWPGELCAALVPNSARKLVDLGFDVMAETGLGDAKASISALIAEFK